MLVGFLGYDALYGSRRKSSRKMKMSFEWLEVGVVIRVDGSCSCRVNIRIVSIFVNPNPTRIINVSIFANPNLTHLLFVLDMST